MPIIGQLHFPFHVKGQKKGASKTFTHKFNQPTRIHGETALTKVVVPKETTFLEAGFSRVVTKGAKIKKFDPPRPTLFKKDVTSFTIKITVSEHTQAGGRVIIHILK